MTYLGSACVALRDSATAKSTTPLPFPRLALPSCDGAESPTFDVVSSWRRLRCYRRRTADCIEPSPSSLPTGVVWTKSASIRPATAAATTGVIAAASPLRPSPSTPHLACTTSFAILSPVFVVCRCQRRTLFARPKEKNKRASVFLQTTAHRPFVARFRKRLTALCPRASFPDPPRTLIPHTDCAYRGEYGGRDSGAFTCIFTC